MEIKANNLSPIISGRSKLPENVLELIGNTPMIKLKRLGADLKSHIFVKCENMNPSGSVKDRMAKYIIEFAEKNGLLKPGGTIVENSSGNTGTSLAMIAAIKGYKCIITMPDKMSQEKRDLMAGFGAKVMIAPTDVPFDSPESYYSMAKQIASEINGAYYPDQYNNPKNIEAHYESTGPEIWEQMQGKIDVFIAGVGTGGTLSGVGKYLKEQNPDIKIIAVDPIGSVFYDYFKAKIMTTPHVYMVEGIGEDYLVKALDFSVIDDFIQVNDKDSFLMARRLVKEEGIFAGGSSGSALHATIEYAKKIEKPLNIVTLLPDSGDRYLSKMFNDNWMKEKGFL